MEIIYILYYLDNVDLLPIPILPLTSSGILSFIEFRISSRMFPKPPFFLQILNILLKRTKTKGWRNHPAIKMWKDPVNALKLYFNKAVKEWTSRGYKNNMKLEIIRARIVLPKWK